MPVPFDLVRPLGSAGQGSGGRQGRDAKAVAYRTSSRAMPAMRNRNAVPPNANLAFALINRGSRSWGTSAFTVTASSVESQSHGQPSWSEVEEDVVGQANLFDVEVSLSP